MLITSVTNDKIKFARSLARRKERVAARQCLIEGTRLVEEAVRAGVIPALVLYERSALNRDARLRQLIAALEKRAPAVYEVTAPVMRALADTETPQGICAVAPLPELPLPAAPNLTLVLDGIRDPGNLGTILRTAWAAGVDAVLLAPETVDPFNPKVLRAGMGAQFNIPLASKTWDEIREYLSAVPRIYLAHAQGQMKYTDADWTPPCALIVGGEVQGTSEAARALATQTLAIPMPGHAESLNAAVAAGILLFEAIRRDSHPDQKATS